MSTAQTMSPAPAGHCNVLVDGVPAIAKVGDNLIDAAKRVNVEIPYFCYHPRLSIAGQCRMCLVETSDMPGRLVAGCQVRVKEGLQIITNTPAIKENQRACMEFHLVNHPVDCPICDQAGECKLQDYYMAYDFKAARLGTFKLNKPKRKVFGPLVVYDGERCILCTRCVRFMNEIAGEPQLAMVGRGDHSEIDTPPGVTLDSKYSGNTVDICPVGALLNRDFRFQSRVWYLDSHRTVCAGCANGCNASADARADKVYRLLPKRNEEVNQVWLCDDGRVSYHRTEQDRVAAPRVGAGEAQEWPTVEAAVDLWAQKFAALKGKPGLAVVLSAASTTEELFAAAVFAKDVLGVNKVFSSGHAPGQGDDFLIRADKNPNTVGLQLAAQAAGLELGSFDAFLQGVQGGQLRSAVLFGAEVPADAGKTAAVLSKLTDLLVVGVTESAVTAAATLLAPQATHFETAGTFVNYYGRLQKFDRVIPLVGDALPLWQWVSMWSARLGARWVFESPSDAFAMLSTRHPRLQHLDWASLPAQGVVVEGFTPASFGARAPRPAPAAAV